MKNNHITSSSRPRRIARYAAAGVFTGAMMLTPLLYADITLTRQLSEGMSGADVSALQTFLAQDRTIYPQGLVTGYFGPLTYAAVANFQARNGIASVGRVGPITMLAINRFGSTGGSKDVNAPAIANVVVTSTASTANVSWTTNEDTQGVLFYSASPITMTENIVNNPDTVSVSGTSIVSDDQALRTSHSVQISGLSEATNYYYVIHATDQSGNVSVTWPAFLHTNQ